jgi:hypothetical protein
VSANFATFTGFESLTDTNVWTRIDFIFGGSNGGWFNPSHFVQLLLIWYPGRMVKQHSVVSALFDDGLFASDHRPIFAEFLLM